MKKALLTIALAAFAFAANAQFVVGGQFDLNHDNSHSKDYGTGNTTTSLTIMPKIGYWLNDNMQVGANLGWNYNYSRSYNGADDTYDSHPTSSITIAPYFRYNVAEWKKFTLFCEASLNLTLRLESKWHDFVKGDETAGYPIDGNDDWTSFGIKIVPGLNYAFNEHVSMDIYVNLASLYWNMTSHGNDNAEHSWGLGVNMTEQTLNQHLNNFGIGFNYAF